LVVIGVRFWIITHDS